MMFALVIIKFKVTNEMVDVRERERALQLRGELLDWEREVMMREAAVAAREASVEEKWEVAKERDKVSKERDQVSKEREELAKQRAAFARERLEAEQTGLKIISLCIQFYFTNASKWILLSSEFIYTPWVG